MAVRNAVSTLFDLLSLVFRRAAGSVYPPGHPLHVFHHEVANSLQGVQQAYLKRLV